MNIAVRFVILAVRTVVFYVVLALACDLHYCFWKEFDSGESKNRIFFEYIPNKL